MNTNFTHGGNVFAVARSLGISPEEILDFSASINPLGPAPGVREAVAAAFDRLVHYPDSDCTELREALAAHHGLLPGQLCVANGSTELIYLLPRAMEGKRALIVAPAFSEYERALTLAGWETDFLYLRPREGFRLSLPLLEERLKERFDLLFLCNPGNPAGNMVAPEDTQRIIDLAQATGTFLVLDEAFIDFCEESSGKRMAVRSGNCIVLRSMTKFYAFPGLRLGYAVASERVIGRLERLRAPWSVNTLAQAAGLASLADAGHRERTLRLVATEQDFLAGELTRIPGLVPYPSAANYLLVEIAAGPSVAELRRQLLSERLLIRDCGNFMGLDDGFFRVAVRHREENERLVRALAGICGAGSGSI
jgi:threonine-phosphate decarboxylase